MNTFITDLQDHIADNVSGLEIDTNFFITGFSGDAKTQYSLRETGSVEAEKDLPILNPTIQIMGKSEDYETVKNKMWQIYQLLHQKVETTMGESSVMQSMAIQEPYHLGEDDTGLEIFTMNFYFKVRNTYTYD